MSVVIPWHEVVILLCRQACTQDKLLHTQTASHFQYPDVPQCGLNVSWRQQQQGWTALGKFTNPNLLYVPPPE